MKILRIAALLLCLLALGAVALCVFTDWNDALFLPLAHALSAAGNLLNVMCNRENNAERKNVK